jgi:hypothetical protein
MTFYEQTWLIVIGGALGGLSELLTELRFGSPHNDAPDIARAGVFLYRECTLNLIDLFFLVLQSIPIGICGAIAIEFALILLGSIKTGESPQDLLFVLSMSAASGFGARRLLPRLTSQLESKVIDIEQVNKQQNDELENQKIKLIEQKKELEVTKDEADESLLFQRVRDAQEANALPSTRITCISELINCLSRIPDARRYAFRLGHLYKVDGRFIEAFKAMESFLDRIAKNPERIVDIADANYNKSCYATLLWERGRLEYKDIALASLLECFKNPINKEDAKIEKDLEYLRTNAEAEFKRMIAS